MPPNLNWKKKSYQYETNFSEGSLIKKKKKVFVYYVLHFFKDKISFFFVKKKKRKHNSYLGLFKHCVIYYYLPIRTNIKYTFIKTSCVFHKWSIKTLANCLQTWDYIRQIQYKSKKLFFRTLQQVITNKINNAKYRKRQYLHPQQLSS